MEEHTDKHLDRLTEKALRKVSIESPSADFTNRVMDQINASLASKTTVYKPPISRWGWIFIAVSILAMIGYGLFSPDLESLGWVGTPDMSVIIDNPITQALSSVTVSKIAFYAIGVFGLLFFVQIPMMKYYFDRRLGF